MPRLGIVSAPEPVRASGYARATDDEGEELMRVKRLSRVMTATVVLAMLSACGDDPTTVGTTDDTDEPISTTEAPEVSVPVETSPAETVPPEDCVELTDGGPATLLMLDNHFEPDCFTVRVTQPIQLQNEGGSRHNWSLPGRLDEDVDPGGELGLEPIGQLLTPGTYEFLCKYHVESEMRGTMVVVPDV